MREEKYNYQVKSPISYGKLNEGRHIPSTALPYFAEHQDNSYINRLMIGEPVINAYENEKHSSPFGIFIDDKAKNYFEQTLFSENNPNDFYWWKSANNNFEISEHKELFSCILDYYEFYINLSNKHRCKYKPAKIEEHLSRAANYFLSENSEIDTENRAVSLLKSIIKNH
ncbi:MAG: hypothetical protein AB1Z23_04715 [Eubacteriales bacterium]